MPVTGPFNAATSYGGARPGNYFKTTTGWKQPPPYDAPLEYYVLEKLCLSAEKWGTVTTNPDGTVETWRMANSTSPNWLHAPVPSWSGEYYPYTRCYDKLMSEINEAAQLAVDFAERRQAYLMMSRRISQIRQFTKALRRFDYRTCADVLGMGKAQRERARIEYPDAWNRTKGEAQGFANTFLEWNFGWAPLLGTLFEDIPSILDKDFEPVRVSSSARTGYSYKTKQVLGGSRPWSMKCDYNGYCRVSMGCKVKVSNPDLYLAARLGLTNPAAVAWELVPFSFVLDWFGTLGSYLESKSDFHGLSVTNAWTSRKSSIQGSSELNNKDADPLYGGWRMQSLTRNFQRTIGLQGPAIQFKGVQRYLFSNDTDVSRHRAALSVALLLQTLKT